MRRALWTPLTAALFVVFTGCNATVGTGPGTSVPKDAGKTCAEHCTEIGMSLDSVVIMANNVGCVCRAARSASKDAAATAGGMAALIVLDEQSRQQQQQQLTPH